jgi:hypothetical protein
MSKNFEKFNNRKGKRIYKNIKGVVEKFISDKNNGINIY